jgi:chromosome partitioning protein
MPAWYDNPCAKVSDLPLPPLEPRALAPGQVRTLKNLLDRLPRFHQHKGRRRGGAGELHGHARPLRDRAIVHTLLGTGLRREELVNLDLDQVTPSTPEALRAAKKGEDQRRARQRRHQPHRVPRRRWPARLWPTLQGCPGTCPLQMLLGGTRIHSREIVREIAFEISGGIIHAVGVTSPSGLRRGVSDAACGVAWYGDSVTFLYAGGLLTVVDDDLSAAAADEPEVPGRHSEAEDGLGKGAWLATLGLTPADLAGIIIVVCGYKGGIGKTLLAYELAYLLGAILLDLDWDKGNASVAWGYRQEQRSNAPLLDALERGHTPRPLAGGPWRPDLVPCHTDFSYSQPPAEKLTDLIGQWAAQWGQEQQRPLVIDTHPGGSPSTFGAVAAAHVAVSPVVLGEREMEATTGMVEELKSYPLLLIPNEVGISPPERYITQLEKLGRDAAVPIGPAISEYRWLKTRTRRMAITASSPVPRRAQPLVSELHRVAAAVVSHARAAA